MANKSNGYYEKDGKHYVAVTQVQKCLASFGLERWRLQTGCAGVVHNLLVGIDRLLRTNSLTELMEFSKRTDLITGAGDLAAAVLQVESKKAMGTGSNIHKMIEEYVKQHEVTPTEDVKVAWGEVKSFFDEMKFNILGTEMRITSPLGYAGTLDLLINLTEEQCSKLKPYLYGKVDIQPGLTVMDFKTRNNEDGFYDDSGYQIGAYMGAVEGCKQGIIMNINKLTGRIRVKPYGLEFFDRFLKILEVYKFTTAPKWYLKEWEVDE